MASTLKPMKLPEPQLDVIDNFPGWQKATIFLQQLIVKNGFTRIADIGGGANPLLDNDFIRDHGIDYSLLDISQEELNKAPAYYRKIQADMTAPLEQFEERIGENRFELIFSHMFLEHVKDPLATHRNIYAALRPGGLAVHFFPTPNNLPLAANLLLPERITGALVSIFQPGRDRKGTQVKFPAYYAMCGPPNRALHNKFRQLGFDVLQHTGYIGHGYYERVPVLRSIESALRPVLVKAKIPLTSDAVLVLQKPSAN